MKNRNFLNLANAWLLYFFVSSNIAAFAQTFPANFSRVQVANGISMPTAMAATPDGRILVCQQNGAILVIKNGVKLSTPAITIATSTPPNSQYEMGLLGIAIDPQFTTNHYVYVYYTVPSGPYNRISRYTLNGDLIDGTTLVDIISLPVLSAQNHLGGALNFGSDGKLYINVGDNATGTNAQDLDSYFGKLLRINADGSVPTDNPFTGSDVRIRIWAYGLRNPFTSAVDPSSGKLYINDVGQSTFEEINDATQGGKNFGWPNSEGTCTDCGYANPIYTYAHGSGDGVGCAINGGTFLNANLTSYPEIYRNKYFFLDYCNAWINYIDPANPSVRNAFATGIGNFSSYMVTGNDGNLYYLSRNDGALYKIVYNQPPSVGISSPTNGTTFTAPATITLTASATDADGTITKVAFYNGTTLLNEDTSAPYQYAWSSVAAGTYTLTAQATDNAGAITTSTAISIMVNQAPTVNITAPTTGTTFTAPATVTLTASATDTDGTITKVAFYNGTTLLNEDTSAPYQYTWSSVAAGTYTLTAQATDNTGAVTTSTAISITVNQAPTVSITAPATGTTFTAPATVTLTASATDTDGTITKVAFYNGTTLLNEDTSAPYQYAWSSVAAGTYTLTAQATDNTGAVTTSTAVSITVNQAPTVSITAPATGTTFTAPATVTLTASATDTDGTITKVAFYNGTTLLNEDTSAPYQYAWSSVAPGTYTLTAQATDNTGAVTTSAAVSITVNQAPTVSITAPTTGATFTAPATVTLTASATDTDGTITKVAFYNGTTLLNEDTSAPYQYTWSSVAAGTYTLTAQATDNAGAVTTSAATSIIVTGIDVNIALNKSATASSIENGCYASIYAVDGDATTRWSSAAADPQWISVDLGALYTINRVKLVWEAAYGKDYQIQVSADASSWTTIKSVSGNTTLTNDHTGLSANGRYVRMYGTARGTTYGYSIFTFEIYGTLNQSLTTSITAPESRSVYIAPATINITADAANTAGTITKVEFYNGTSKIGEDTTYPYSYLWENSAAGTYQLTSKVIDNTGATATSGVVEVTISSNLALRKSAVASSIEGTCYEASKAIDGDSGTRWSSELGVDTEWIYVDLGASYTIGRVKITWEAAYGRNYLLQTSSNATDWTTLKTVTANTTLTNDHTGLSGNGRYVRIFATARATTYGYSIYEIEIYENPGVTNQSPTVSITAPTTGTTFTAPATVTLTASATDTDGTITKVAFYNGTILLNEDTSAPYQYTWSSVAAGTYTLTAQATDNAGAVTTSTAMSITVNAANQAPTVSITAPTTGTTFTAPATVTLTASATDADGTITKVAFYNGTTLLNEDTSAPYQYAWSSVAAGTYTLTAQATDNAGAITTSTAISITVNAANQAPTVSITAPTTGTTFTAPATVTLTASATDTDGTITKVAFYNGTTLLNEDTSTPYQYAWSSVAAGTYTLTAQATDNAGAVTTSTAISITVNAANQAPTVSITAPTTGTTFTAPATVTLTASATDTDGTITKVAFYNGTTLLNEDTSTPYQYAWSSVAAGTYTLTAQATDNAGAVTTSTAISITVTSASTASALKVQYCVKEVNATDNQIKPNFIIVNTGSQQVAYTELTLRYWYTKEGSAAQNFWCDYASFGSASVVANFSAMSSAFSTANYYMELGFTTTAILAANSTSGEIKTRFAKTDWTAFNETGDYSYDPSKTAFTDWDRATLYRNGVLVWGIEPSATSTAVRIYTNSPTEIYSLLLPEKTASVFPNPVNDILTIQVPEKWKKAKLTVYNALDKIVLNTEIEGSEGKLDMSNMSVGLYMIQLSNDSDRIMYRVIKR